MQILISKSIAQKFKTTTYDLQVISSNLLALLLFIFVKILKLHYCTIENIESVISL